MGKEKKTNKTTVEHVKQLQAVLIQACIDYINRYGLSDVWAISFRADSLNESAEAGCWQPATDSYIKLEGIRQETVTGKDGEQMQVRASYTIWEYM